nr:hypothetical protein Iba_chr01dCG6630 [Ipomoea batatas]
MIYGHFTYANGFLMKLKAYSVMFLVNGKCIFVTAGCIRREQGWAGCCGSESLMYNM